LRDEKAMESERSARLLGAWRTIARALAEAKTLAEAAPAVLEAAGTAEGWRLAEELTLLEDPAGEPALSFGPFQVRTFRLVGPRR